MLFAGLDARFRGNGAHNLCPLQPLARGVTRRRFGASCSRIAPAVIAPAAFPASGPRASVPADLTEALSEKAGNKPARGGGCRYAQGPIVADGTFDEPSNVVDHGNFALRSLNGIAQNLASALWFPPRSSKADKHGQQANQAQRPRHNSGRGRRIVIEGDKAPEDGQDCEDDRH